MAVFAYKAVGADASSVAGLIVADTPRDARDTLRARGLTVQDVTPHRAGGAGARVGGVPAFRFGGSGRASSARVVSFVRELSTLLGVGIPLVEAIDTIHAQHRGRFAAALLALRDRVSGGAGLADAMREQPDVFDEMCASIAEVGENAGTLDVALERVADFKERAAQFKSRLGTVLLYPAIVLAMAVVVSVLLMTLVVPNLLSSLQEAGKPLPLPTRVVKAASDALVGYWWAMALGAAALALATRAVLNTDRGRLAWHRLQLRTPLLGDLVRKQAMVRLCVILSTLLRSGVVFVRAIQIARRATPNRVLAAALDRCEAAVSTGRDIAEALDETGAFPPVVVRVFSVGQQSGKLEEMLDRLATDYDRQVATASQRLTAILEPLLILGLVVLVGFIGLATIMPLLDAADVF